MGGESIGMVRYYFKIYRLMIKQDFKNKLQFRVDFLISIFAVILSNILGIVSFWLICRNVESIKDWSYHELIFMYGFSLVAMSPANVMFCNAYNLNTYVQNGEFVKYLFKPVDILFYYFGETIDIKSLFQFVVGNICMFYAWNEMNMKTSIIEILEICILMSGAVLIGVAIMLISSSTAFITVYGSSFLNCILKFTEYTKYPISIFNGVMKFILSFLVPIAFLAYYPCTLILGKNNSIPLLLLTPLMGIFAFALSYRLWICGAKNYNGTGN